MGVQQKHCISAQLAGMLRVAKSLQALELINLTYLFGLVALSSNSGSMYTALAWSTLLGLANTGADDRTLASTF